MGHALGIGAPANNVAAGNMPQNIAGSAQVGSQYQNAMNQSQQNAAGYSEPALADKIKWKREHMACKATVMEFFEAQLNLDLFKDDKRAKDLFLTAMRAAFEAVEKA
jgi:hypothetical protein